MALPLNQIKENIQTIFETANTTTAAFDLSTGMSQRVAKILKLNVTRMPVQASYYPFVSVFYEGKSIETATIAQTQQAGRRRAALTFNIVGAVFVDTFGVPDEDPADEDLENLMENVEEILRSNTKLNDTSGSVIWSVPTEVEYATGELEEETIVRVGTLTLEATVFYT